MGRQPLSLRRVLVAACACFAFACGLDTTGLEFSRGDAGSTKYPPITDGSAPPGVSVDGAGAADDGSIDDVAEPDVHVLGPDAADYPDSGNPCDLDQDGYESSSGECAGTDCCDFDGRAYPGETKYYGSADACGSFDYDCNGKADGQYGIVNCVYGIPCTGDGFDKAPPPCGTSATFDTCNFALFLCAEAQSTVTEDCR